MTEDKSEKTLRNKLRCRIEFVFFRNIFYQLCERNKTRSSQSQAFSVLLPASLVVRYLMSFSLRHLECSGSFAERESSYTINEGCDTVRCAITHLDQNLLTEQCEEI